MADAHDSMSLFRRLTLGVGMRPRFRQPAWRHRDAIREAAYLGAHLEEDVFPPLRADGEETLSIDCREDGPHLREGLRAPERPLPGAASLATLLREVPSDTLRLSTRLESSQAIEAVLTLLHVRDAGPRWPTQNPAALADVHDALISKRVHKEAFSHAKAERSIPEGLERHFDPAETDAFPEEKAAFVRIAAEHEDEPGRPEHRPDKETNP